MAARLARRAVLQVFCKCTFTTKAASTGSSLASKQDKIRGAYFGALVADALTLGSHYEYDAPKIKEAYGGTISKYMAPGERMGGETHGIGWGQRNYHPGTTAGDQTDYGEYNVLVLEHLAAQSAQPHAFEVQEFIPLWQQRLQTWKQWICTQTKQTYQQVQQSAPVSDLGGISNAMALRCAPAFAYYSTEAGVVDASRKAMFTHRSTEALEGGEFFARVTFRVIHQGLEPEAAIVEVAAESSEFVRQKVQQALDKAAEAADPQQPLSREEFVDDIALTSMARLWDASVFE